MKSESWPGGSGKGEKALDAYVLGNSMNTKIYLSFAGCRLFFFFQEVNVPVSLIFLFPRRSSDRMAERGIDNVSPQNIVWYT